MLKYPNDHPFYNEYLESLITRFTHPNINLESSSDIKTRIMDNMYTFKYLLTYIPEPLTEKMILELGNLVNQKSMYIKDGYRTLGNYSNELNIPISDPIEIKNDIQKLLNDYNKLTDVDPYEREAQFHIRLIRIHPFEDGNRRTARFLLNYNLMKQNLPPVIITTDLEEYYKSYIKEESIEGMANLFRIQSKKEKNIIEQMQRQYLLNKNECDKETMKKK